MRKRERERERETETETETERKVWRRQRDRQVLASARPFGEVKYTGESLQPIA